MSKGSLMNESLLARAKFILKTAGNDCAYSPKHELLPLIAALVDELEFEQNKIHTFRRIVDYPR